MSLLPVALSCGDPAGIGPEIAAGAWALLKDEVPFFLIGDAAHLPADTPRVTISAPSEAASALARGLPVLHQDFAAPVRPGQPDGANAVGVIAAIERGVALVQDGTASALCTNPISKQVLQEGGGFGFPGHTEFLAHLAGGCDVVMMLASDQLRTVPATIHIPLSEVPRALTPATLERVLRITEAGLRDRFGIAAPRIAVAGLNPHAGEGGRMGREETDWIAPLIARLAAEGMALRGPLPADTMFHPAARATYDAAVAMYHDQALIPIKTLAFDTGVNVTLGLPFVRTSPDHGTAFDIAGRGVASASSLVAALRMAHRMGTRR